jgi:hypothetical protein
VDSAVSPGGDEQEALSESEFVRFVRASRTRVQVVHRERSGSTAKQLLRNLKKLRVNAKTLFN